MHLSVQWTTRSGFAPVRPRRMVMPSAIQSRMTIEPSTTCFRQGQKITGSQA